MIEKILKSLESINLLVVIYSIISIVIFIGGCLLNVSSILIYIPKYIQQTCNYGKLNQGEHFNKLLSAIQVPKRWFQHFYIVALVYAFYFEYLHVMVYLYNKPVPQWINYTFDFLTYPRRVAVVSKEQAILVLSVYSLHIIKRLYESLFISVFSSSKMNIFQYLLGHIHYAGAFIILTSQFPGLCSINFTTSSSNVTKLGEVCGFIAVIAAMISQFDSFRRLAALRISSKSEIAEEDYFLPSGGLFEWVSCPHMFCEIIVYFGLAFMMGLEHTSWHFVCLFVLCNQFILRAEVIKLYRSFLREIKKIPDEVQRKEIREWVRTDFENNRHQTDEHVIRGLIMMGNKSLKELRTTVDIAKS